MVSTTQRERSDRCGVAPTTCKSASEMLIDTRDSASHNLTQIKQIYQIRLSNSLQVKNRSERTKAEAKLRLIARGERSVTPGMNNHPREASGRCENACQSSGFASFRSILLVQRNRGLRYRSPTAISTRLRLGRASFRSSSHIISRI